MIFAANSLPLPNSSRTISTMSSACASDLAKIRVFGTSVRPGKISVNSRSLNVLHDRADLVLGHDRAVEVLGLVVEVLVELLQPLGSRLAVAELRHEAGFDRRALLGDLGPDPVHVEVDVHAVGDGLLVAVLHHEVLVEEPERLLARASRSAR